VSNDDLGSLESNGKLNDRLFLYEVIMRSVGGEVPSSSHYRQSQFTLKVPYRRMKQEIQRITQLGGEILKITPWDFHLEHPYPNLPWWVEIETSQPNCLYYFGPFDELDEADSSKSGYLEDLRLEGAQNIRVQVKQCQPTVLTLEK
jgi:hypothetical protein